MPTALGKWFTIFFLPSFNPLFHWESNRRLGLEVCWSGLSTKTPQTPMPLEDLLAKMSLEPPSIPMLLNQLQAAGLAKTAKNASRPTVSATLRSDRGALTFRSRPMAMHFEIIVEKRRTGTSFVPPMLCPALVNGEVARRLSSATDNAMQEKWLWSTPSTQPLIV